MKKTRLFLMILLICISLAQSILIKIHSNSDNLTETHQIEDKSYEEDMPPLNSINYLDSFKKLEEVNYSIITYENSENNINMEVAKTYVIEDKETIIEDIEALSGLGILKEVSIRNNHENLFTTLNIHIDK